MTWKPHTPHQILRYSNTLQKKSRKQMNKSILNFKFFFSTQNLMLLYFVKFRFKKILYGIVNIYFLDNEMYAKIFVDIK